MRPDRTADRRGWARRMAVAAARGGLLAVMALTSGLVAVPAGAGDAAPVKIAVVAEYSLRGSETAQSIEKGVRLALGEINARGGVLGGRPLELLTRDDRGIPARAADHLLALLDDPDVVAVFGGRMSPSMLVLAPIANREHILLLDPWAAADAITGSGPGYVFRLSLTDSWAMDAMLRHALDRGIREVAVLLPNTAWGRSSEAALGVFADDNPPLRYEVMGYNWGDTEFADKLARARASGMRALILVANEMEGMHVVQQMAALPAELRLPIIAHWGITGGNFPALVGPALHQVDLVVPQSFSFQCARGPRVEAVVRAYGQMYGEPVEDLPAQVGFAHAYDLTHLLALAIEQAGSDDPPAVRHALERLPAHDGLVRHYPRAFTPDDHEALDRQQVIMARFGPDGRLRRIDEPRSP